MKKNIFLFVAVVAISGLSLYAQPNQRPAQNPDAGQRMMRSNDFVASIKLDDKQHEEIEKIRTQEVKERTQMQNALKEKRAKLEGLQTADKPDMKEVNKTIDEISSLLAQEMKTTASNRQKIRSILTEEQRVYFDARSSQRGSQMRADARERSKSFRNDSFRGQNDSGDMRNSRKTNPAPMR